MMNNNEFYTEMHLHTAETSNCGKMPAAKSVKKYIKLGYKTIVVTDHLSTHTYSKYDYNFLSWNEKIDIFLLGYKKALCAANKKINILLGMELRFENENNPNDYLVYGIDENFLRKNGDLLKMKISSFSELAHRNGLLVYQAHPFRFGMKITNPDLLDGIEVFNGNIEHNSNNDIAEIWAEKYNLKRISGSDHHKSGNEGMAGIITNKEITSNDILLGTLNNNEYKIYKKL